MRLEISVRLKTARRILPKVTLRASLLKAKYSLAACPSDESLYLRLRATPSQRGAYSLREEFGSLQGETE